ncbi:cell cycle regulator protein, putative [Plasmodium malariae]|uniref:Cell cycle regulator protein, putative n=1 Tax=Plasmodium malariae TaxID=5858 RepID=A0A1C3KDB3_PLAMA|nr:cell cycle regulator protein, putative [Plasmodium malariae]
MPQIQVDKGAIKHVLRGSNIMCPGVTSPGGKLDDVEANTVVVILEINKDTCVENIHYLNDGLWNCKIES